VILGELGWRGKEFDEFEETRLDEMLTRTHRDGLTCRSLLMNSTVVLEMAHLAEGQGTLVCARQEAADGLFARVVTGYRHPVTSQMVGIHCAPSLPDGCIRFSDVAPTWPEPHPDEPRA